MFAMKKAKLTKETNETDAVEVKGQSWTGYVFALLASVFAASGSLLIKISVEDNMLIVFMRCLIQFLFLLPLASYKKLDLTGGKLITLGLMVLRGCLATTAINTYVESLKYLPLGDAGAIVYTYPVFVTVFAWICLKGK